MLKSSIWPCVRDAIHKDPLPFAQLLDINKPKAGSKAAKSFVQIMTSKGKGKTIETQNAI